MTQYRRCQKCGCVKPMPEFSRNRAIESGFLWKCKSCEADDASKWLDHTRLKR